MTAAGRGRLRPSGEDFRHDPAWLAVEQGLGKAIALIDELALLKSEKTQHGDQVVVMMDHA